MKEQVIKFEKILNESTDIVLELEKALERMEKNEARYRELKEYYGSEEYFKDVELSDYSDVYDNIACGVLSEDAVSDLIMDTYAVSIRMLELATQLLKYH